MLVRDRAGSLTDAQRNLIEQAEKSCARMAGLLTELSDIANLDAGTATFNRSRVDLFPLFDEVAEELRGTGEQPLEVEVRGENGPAILDGDSTRLRAAFSAIGRAVSREQFANPRLVIDRAVVPQGDGAVAVILVGDDTAFEPMRTADLEQLGAFDELRGGLGLALPAARRVIEAHGGQIRAPKPPHERVAAAVRLPVQAAGNGRPR